MSHLALLMLSVTRNHEAIPTSIVARPSTKKMRRHCRISESASQRAVLRAANNATYASEPTDAVNLQDARRQESAKGSGERSADDVKLSIENRR